MDISFTDSTISIILSGQGVIPGFSPDNHHEFALSFHKVGNAYEAVLPDFQRGMSAGKFGPIIDQLPADIVPIKLSAPLRITVHIPMGKVLFWGCQLWTDESAILTFRDYFQAREFPIILVDRDRYLVRTSWFNKLDSMSVVYIWDDSTGHAALPTAFTAVDTAALNFGLITPTYLDKHVMAYFSQDSRKQYMLAYFITSRRIMTGAEHYSQPFVITPPKWIREDGVFHTLFHSLVGKSIIPKEYMRSDGRYCPADALGMYEGLTTYMSNKYIRDDFAANLSAMLYRACLRPDLIDLRKIGLDAEQESYYAKGYLFWLYMEANGLNVELFTKWLFSIYLINKPFPYQFDWQDVVHWISTYDQRLGKLAEEVSSGAYLDAAFEILEKSGWSPIPLKDMPDWYDFYVGPYSVKPGGYQLPTNEYPLMDSAYPEYLLENGKKFQLEANKNNPALRRIKDNPSQMFSVQFSDSRVIELRDSLTLGSRPYFLGGKIDYQKNPDFWRMLTKYTPIQ
ncbi:MAG: hypothetical protein WC453_00690 [Patescibacteria group bacterium]